MAKNQVLDQNILLVSESGDDTLRAIAAIGKNGTVETVEATMENAGRFLKFNRYKPEELAAIVPRHEAESHDLLHLHSGALGGGSGT